VYIELDDEVSTTSYETTKRRKKGLYGLHYEEWRDACLRAKNAYYDVSLPSLEEAALLFGFTN